MNILIKYLTGMPVKYYAIAILITTLSALYYTYHVKPLSDLREEVSTLSNDKKRVESQLANVEAEAEINETIHTIPTQTELEHTIDIIELNNTVAKHDSIVESDDGKTIIIKF